MVIAEHKSGWGGKTSDVNMVLWLNEGKSNMNMNWFIYLVRSEVYGLVSRLYLLDHGCEKAVLSEAGYCIQH